MDEMREGDSGKKERLGQTSSEMEVIDIAIQFEEAAASFYRQLQHKVSKPLRWLVQSLAEEENLHAERLKALRSHSDLQKQLKERLIQMNVDPRFTDAIQTPSIDSFTDDQSILLYALSREQLALEQYGALADESQPGPVQDLFRWLSNEEVDHKAELEKRYYEMVHQGGGV